MPILYYGIEVCLSKSNIRNTLESPWSRCCIFCDKLVSPGWIHALLLQRSIPKLFLCNIGALSIKVLMSSGSWVATVPNEVFEEFPSFFLIRASYLFLWSIFWKVQDCSTGLSPRCLNSRNYYFLQLVNWSSSCVVIADCRLANRYLAALDTAALLF